MRPELLMDVLPSETNSGKCSLKTTILILAIVAAVIGGGVSLLASSNPDGLEWSMFGNEEAGYSANMGLDEENYGISSAVSDFTGTVQEKTAFLPDYAFSNSDSAAGTTVSGLLGSVIVAGAATLICFAGKFFRKKKTS